MTEEEIFDAVLQLPQSERETYLEQACQSDPNLLASVKVLLKYHSESSNFMRASAIDTLVDSEAWLQPGATIGPYRLMEPLGQGGMGIVYRAMQSEPVAREVAIKVIKPGLDTREIVSRFRAEQRALAVMDHPFVAKVLEAGSTANGRPYFVMELVNGVSITEYCDRERLPIEARLQLIIDVCSAVQHAHSKSIIHRDIKPTNVLVVQKDGRPVPKVIDFGVAKALDRETADQTFQTQVTQVIGTPIYMSPEQADPRIKDIDTRTDVYSLGVLTYELLTGYTPFDRERLSRLSLEEVRRIIRDEEPPKPSTRLSALGDKASMHALARGSEPKRLMRQMQGDLDWIVMKTLDKDRERRYATANDLANDLRRFLNYEPVLASPPSRLYRLKRSLWRHRVAVSVTTTILVLSVLGTVGTTVGLLASRKANTKLAQALASEQLQLQEARLQREVADSVIFFLNQDLLSAAKPSMDAGKGYDVRMRDVLLVAGKNIEEAAKPGGRFHDKPQVESQIRYTIGRTFASLGLHTEAVPHLERAKKLLDDCHASEEALLPTLSELSSCYARTGRMVDGIELAKRIVQARQKINGEDSEATQNAKHDLAAQTLYVGRFEEACQILEEVRANRLKNHGPTDWPTLETELTLATAYVKVNKLDLAENLFQKVLAVGRERKDANVIGTVLKYLAEVRYEQKRMPEARKLLEEAYDNLAKHQGAEHPETIAVIGMLGAVEAEMGQYEESKKNLTIAYNASSKAGGPVGSFTVTNRLNLAATLWDGKYRDEAVELIQNHLQETVVARGHDNIWVRRIFFQIDLMAEAYEKENALDRAEPLRRLALEHDLALATVDQPTIADLRKAATALADSKHASLRDATRATALLEQALQLSRATSSDQTAAIEAELERVRSTANTPGVREAQPPL